MIHRRHLYFFLVVALLLYSVVKLHVTSVVFSQSLVRCKCEARETTRFVNIFQNSFGLIKHEYLVNYKNGLVSKIGYDTAIQHENCDLGFSKLKIVKGKKEKYGSSSVIVDQERVVAVSIIIKQKSKYYLLTINKTRSYDSVNPSPVRFLHATIQRIDICSGKLIAGTKYQETYIYANLKSKEIKQIDKDLLAKIYNPEVITSLTVYSEKSDVICSNKNKLVNSFKRYREKKRLIYPFYKPAHSKFVRYKTRKGLECVIRRFEYKNPRKFNKNIF